MASESAWELATVLVVALALVLWSVDLTTSIVVLVLVVAGLVALQNGPVQRALMGAYRDVLEAKLKLALIVIMIVLMIVWSFSLESVTFITLFVAFLLYQWDSRIFAAGALVSLASCPILLTVQLNSYAEQMAVYAYYFLVMTVALQIVEYKRNPNEYPE